jgi:endonuclease/exonuclease/phosphatase family metal-dependent hydrolase
MYTAAVPANLKLKFCSFNVNRTFELEKTDDLCWNKREDKVVQILKKINPDIMCLQELRVLDGCKTNAEFLALFKEYEFFRAGRNASKLAFQQATGWNSNKLFASENVVRWLVKESQGNGMPNDVNPKGWGSIALFTRLNYHIDGKICKNMDPFWVVNVHFPLGEEDKTLCCEHLCDIIVDVCGDEEYIVAGDFNTFYDKDGKNQVEFLLKSLPYLRDATEYMTTSQYGSKIFGTFIGTSKDKFNQTPPNLSHLDHIFLSFERPFALSANSIVHTETMNDPEPPELSERDMLPSDHLPVSIDIFLNVE